MDLKQKIDEQNAAIANLVMEVAGEKQRADQLQEQAQHAAAAVQAEQPAPVADATMSMALEMVDACMDVTQVEPEDAAAWQIVRRSLAAPVAAPVAMPAVSVQPDFHVTETHGTAIVDAVRGQAKILGKEVRAYTIPAASVHDLEMQQYIGARLRRVATAAGVTVDYGDDDFYYAGAFSILGDIARALEKTAASVQPANWKDAFRRCGANPDYHGIIAFTAQQLEHFIRLLNPLSTVQPDSGRDAALLDLRNFEDGQWWVKELDEAVQNGTDDQKRAVAVVRNMLKVAALAAHPAPSIDAAQFVVQRPDGYFHIAAGRAVERAEDAKKFSEEDATALANIFTSEHRENAMTSASKAVRDFKLTQCAKVIQVAHPANVAQVGELSDDDIKAVAINYAAHVAADIYDVTKYDCAEDFFNCVRAILAAAKK